MLSAAVGIPLLLIVVVAGGRAYDVVLALVLAAAAIEFLLRAGLKPNEPLPWLAGATAGGLSLAAGASPEWTAALLTAFLVLSLLAALRSAATGPLECWSLSVAIALYAGWLGRYLALLRHGAGGREWVLLVLLVTFASDTGAYAVGKLLGRHRLAPSISPSKTIEGAVGGVLAAAVVAILLRAALGGHLRMAALALGVAVSVAAQLGDLGESALKRRLNIKDAGWLLPGHGGLLDRLDSLLFAGAMVYYAVQWVSL